MRPFDFLRRLVGGFVAAAMAIVAGVPHRHATLADLAEADALVSDGGEHVVSSHNPFSKSTHWHAVKLVKHDDCVACQSHRSPTAAPSSGDPTPVLLSDHALVERSLGLTSTAHTSPGARAPPTLL